MRLKADSYIIQDIKDELEADEFERSLDFITKLVGYAVLILIIIEALYVA